MEEAKEKMLDFKACNVEACRICLTTEVKMYSLQNTHLGTCFESISGFTKSYEGLPNYVCYECAPILIKCNKIIEKSKTAQATLLDIFTKNGQINKSLIDKQNKSQKMQSSLDSYLLLNYFYIKYDDDNNTSDFIKLESDPNEKVKIKKEIKEESSDELSDSEILKMFKDMSEGEQKHSESDVEAIEVDVPTVEIISDDEKLGDDFISLKSYKVKEDSHGEPLYHQKRVSGMAFVKKAKKKKIKKKKIGPIETLSSVHLNENYVKKFFNVNIIPPATRTTVKYSCKFCPETFEYADEARDHTIIGCQKPQRSNRNSSTFPAPESNSSSVKTHETWKEWPGCSK